MILVVLTCKYKSKYSKVEKNVNMKVLVTDSCPTLCQPMDCSPLGSSVHGILQARILEWVAISFSRGSSWPRDPIWVSCTSGRFFTIWTTRETCKNLLTYFISKNTDWMTRHIGTSEVKFKFKNIDLYLYKYLDSILNNLDSLDNLDSIWKSRDITFPTNFRLVKALAFPESCMDVRVGL